MKLLSIYKKFFMFLYTKPEKMLKKVLICHFKNICSTIKSTQKVYSQDLLVNFFETFI